MIDFNRRDLRSKIIGEGIRAINDGDRSRLDTAVKNAKEQYFLDLAEYIIAYDEFKHKNFPTALQHLENALTLDPNFPQAHLVKSTLFIEMGKYEDAIKSIDYSLQNLVLLSYAGFYNNKGVAFSRLGRLDEALFCYLRAIESDKNYDMAYRNSLLVFAEKGAWLDLLTIAQTIRQNFSKNPDFLNGTAVTLLNFAESLFREGNLDLSNNLLEEAGKQLEIAIGLQPENNSILYNLSCFYSRSNKRPEAIETLKKALEKAPSNDIRMGLLQTAHDDVDFANIREDPLFKELLAVPT